MASHVVVSSFATRILGLCIHACITNHHAFGCFPDSAWPAPTKQAAMGQALQLQYPFVWFTYSSRQATKRRCLVDRSPQLSPSHSMHPCTSTGTERARPGRNELFLRTQRAWPADSFCIGRTWLEGWFRHPIMRSPNALPCMVESGEVSTLVHPSCLGQTAWVVYLVKRFEQEA
jgi:hypothetical protein